MGFLDWLSPALTTATQGVTGYMAGREQAQQRDQSNAMQMLQLLRQQQQDATERQWRDAQMRNLQSEEDLRSSTIKTNTFKEQQHAAAQEAARQTLLKANPSDERYTTPDPTHDYLTELGVWKGDILKKGDEKRQNDDAMGNLKLYFPEDYAKLAADPTGPNRAKDIWNMRVQEKQTRLQASLRPEPGANTPEVKIITGAVDPQGRMIGQAKDGTPQVWDPQRGWVPAGGVARPAGAAGGGGLSLSPADRAKMLVQAKLDHKTMTDYEDKIKGKGLGWLTTAATGMAHAENKGIIGALEKRAGNALVGVTDADYQKYLNAQASYGRIMGNLQSKRYTENQAKIEKDISGLAGGDLDSTIAYKQQLREASLNDPDTVEGPTPTTPSGTGMAPPRRVLTPAQKLKLKQKGFTDEQISQY